MFHKLLLAYFGFFGVFWFLGIDQFYFLLFCLTGLMTHLMSKRTPQTVEGGARASANLYSLIETAKANDQEPYRYLCWLFEQLPITPVEQIETLAPWNMPA